MVFFVGSGGSDYLDFVGPGSDPQVLKQVLEIARERTPNFVGFRFYHVPDVSRTGRVLAHLAPQLGLACFEEQSYSAPALVFSKHPAEKRPPSEKQSLLRHERYFRNHGDLEVQDLRRGDEIRPHLQSFFDQHVERWSRTPHPSLFQDPKQRAFYQRLAEAGGAAGWLRFTRLTWNDSPIAFHFGFSYGGGYLWYKPTFDIGLARRSPGEVLLRQLLLAAGEEGCHTFDFGMGDEPFKSRFATQVNCVRTWGLYPTETMGRNTTGRMHTP